MEDLRWNKNRVALMELGLSKQEKTRMLEAGTAQKIFHYSGSNGYRLYTSKDIAEQILLEKRVERCDAPQMQKSI